jgi:hypothetical protein
MLEFETFAYLDVQKTGSTFICYFLQKFSKEREVRYKQHQNVGDAYDRSKFYFISVRDPLDQYLSLYSFGCGGDGALRKKLHRKGLDDLYDSTWKGFRQWLKFALAPENAAIFAKEYGENQTLSGLIGFQTYRFLELALPSPLENLGSCQTREEIREAYRQHNVSTYTIRNETLDSDLRTLLNERLSNSVTDLNEALDFLSEGHRLNTSDRFDKFQEDTSLPQKIEQKLQDREWLLHELFGY